MDVPMHLENWSLSLPFFFFKYSYLLNAVLTQSFLIFTSRGGKYFCFQGKWYNINLLMDW